MRKGQIKKELSMKALLIPWGCFSDGTDLIGEHAIGLFPCSFERRGDTIL